ncbi:hypothetical protein D3C81_1251650 [compost metagenome]
MDALEDLREGLALLEVQATVVGGVRRGPAAVVVADEVLVGIGRGPTGAERQRGVELAFDLANVEADGLRLGGNTKSHGGHGERKKMRLEESGPYCFCHAAFSVVVGKHSRNVLSGERPDKRTKVVICVSPGSMNALYSWAFAGTRRMMNEASSGALRVRRES